MEGSTWSRGETPSHLEPELPSASFPLHNTFHFALESEFSAEGDTPSVFDAEIGRGRKEHRKDYTGLFPRSVHVYHSVSLDLK